MANIFEKIWAEIWKEKFSALGSLFGVAFYGYNLLKPTTITIAPQSALGQDLNLSLAVSLGTIGLMLVILFVALATYRVNRRHKRRR